MQRMIVVIIVWVLLPVIAYCSPNIALWLHNWPLGTLSPAAILLELNGAGLVIFLVWVLILAFIRREAAEDVSKIVIPSTVGSIDELLESSMSLQALSILPWILGSILVLRGLHEYGVSGVSAPAHGFAAAWGVGMSDIRPVSIVCGIGWLGIGALIRLFGLVISPAQAILTGIGVLLELVGRR